MAPKSFTMSDVERLTASLDPLCAELDERDRELLHAVFAWAGQAVGSEAAEVEGFGALSPPMVGGLANTFGRGPQYIEIYSWSFGATNATTTGGQGDAEGKINAISEIKP
jgi:hypothetical protein